MIESWEIDCANELKTGGVEGLRNIKQIPQRYSGCQKYVPFGVSQMKAVVLTLSATLTYDNRYSIFFSKKRWTFANHGSGSILWHGLA